MRRVFSWFESRFEPRPDPVGITWRNVDASGNPDAHVADNPQVPVYLVGTVEFAGTETRLKTSSVSALERYVGRQV